MAATADIGTADANPTLTPTQGYMEAGRGYSPDRLSKNNGNEVVHKKPQ